MTSQTPTNSTLHIPTIHTIFPSERPSNYSELSAAEKYTLDFPLAMFHTKLLDKGSSFTEAQSIGFAALVLFEDRFMYFEESAFKSAFEKAVAKWAQETSEEERRAQSEKGYDVLEWVKKMVAEGSKDLEIMNGNFRRLRKLLNELDFGQENESEDDGPFLNEELEEPQDLIIRFVGERFDGLKCSCEA